MHVVAINATGKLDFDTAATLGWAAVLLVRDVGYGCLSWGGIDHSLSLVNFTSMWLIHLRCRVANRLMHSKP